MSHRNRMALDDLQGVVVASGTWFSDGTIRKRATIVARDYDVKWSMYQAEGWLEDDELPATPGPDGLYYYVSNTGPFATIAEAKAWAADAWGPIEWDGPAKRLLRKLLAFIVATP